MSKLPLIARILLGLVFTVFGSNKFLNFIPIPAMPEAAGAFMGSLAKAGFFFPLLATVETASGCCCCRALCAAGAGHARRPHPRHRAVPHHAGAGGAPDGGGTAGAGAVPGVAYRDAFAGVLNANARPKAQ